MGLISTKQTLDKKRELGLNQLEIDYLLLTKKNMRTLYLLIQNNPYNTSIAIKKKQYKKMTAVKKSLMSYHRKKQINWKDYLLSYFEKQKEQGLLWYSIIINNISNELFLNENNYLSMMFYQGYEIDTKSEALDRIIKEEEIDIDVDVGYMENERKVKGEDSIINNHNDTNNKDGFVNKIKTNLSNNVTCLSRIDLSQLTDNLGGSFSSKFDADISNFETKTLLRKFIKLFKQHVIEVNHPINKVIQIFEQTLSFIIKEKIIELETMKNNDDKEYKVIMKDLCEEIVSHIQMFVIKSQSALKLFYTEAINLQIFNEEKDELINVICSILFNTGKLYDNIYQLFSMQMSTEVFEFDQKIVKQKKLAPLDLNINVKFRLDDSTKQLMNDIIDKHNAKEKEKERLKGDKDTNNLMSINNISDLNDNDHEINGNNINDNYKKDNSNEKYKIVMTKSNFTKINKKFYTKNPIKEYNTAIKIIHSVKYTNDPFEKMMLIASLGSEVTNCVNLFWKGMDPYISSTFLSITPDDLVAIFIYIVLKSEMPEILIHNRIIKEFTTSTTQLSSMGYYNTTIQAALDYIQKNSLHNQQRGSKNKESIDENNQVYFCFEKDA